MLLTLVVGATLVVGVAPVARAACNVPSAGNTTVEYKQGGTIVSKVYVGAGGPAVDVDVEITPNSTFEFTSDAPTEFLIMNETVPASTKIASSSTLSLTGLVTAAGAVTTMSAEGTDESGHYSVPCGNLDVIVLKVDLKVTDERTQGDTVPYSAYAPADDTQNQNEELCLRGNSSTDDATVLIDLPEITGAATRSLFTWKVLEQPSGNVIASGVLPDNTSASSTLSLQDSGTVAAERLFLVQIGMTAGSGVFNPQQQLQVRLVRDRVNWWFEPHTADAGWIPSMPEKRADAGDYAAPQTTTYARESLQSVYEYLRSTQSYGSISRGSWLDQSITCFGEFHEALKAVHSDPLVDLNQVARLNLSSVVEVDDYSEWQPALRFTLVRQTTYGCDANPLFVANQAPERVGWTEDARDAIGNANLTTGVLLALWQREGSMRLNNQDDMATYAPWPIGFSATSATAPATPEAAKTIYVYDVAYIALGSDYLLKKSGGADNQPDLTDYGAARSYFITQADAAGGAGMGADVLSQLTVTTLPGGGYTVAANGEFYRKMLELAGRHYLSVWQSEGPDATYMAYNMGMSKYNQMKATLTSGSYPERGRLGLVNWAVHYEIRGNEWDQPRDHAHKFNYYRSVFERQYP